MKGKKENDLIPEQLTQMPKKKEWEKKIVRLLRCKDVVIVLARAVLDGSFRMAHLLNFFFIHIRL